jgi:hypothetical protein
MQDIEAELEKLSAFFASLGEEIRVLFLQLQVGWLGAGLGLGWGLRAEGLGYRV